MHVVEILGAVTRAALAPGAGPEPFEDALGALLALAEAGEELAETAWSRWLRELALARVAEAASRMARVTPEAAAALAADADRLLAAAEDMCGRDARRDLDSYILWMEWGRAPEKRFWRPRREALLPVCMDMQDLADGRIDFLAVSLPPRVGKSTLSIFFLTWMMGRRPTRANLMSGHSDKLTVQFHTEALSIISSPEYRFAETFPEAPLMASSARDESISLKRAGRFPTLTCRSVDGTLTGAVEVGRGALLYCDDLVSDREQALSDERMDKLYSAYLNQLRDRKLDGALELHVGTRWCPNDPIGRIEADHAGDPRYRFTSLPALDGTPAFEEMPVSSVRAADEVESVFERGGERWARVSRPLGLTRFGYGFSTGYYYDMRAALVANGEEDSWLAKYMGRPVWIGGRLFEEGELRWYDGTLPEGEPDAAVAVCDTKDRGKDYACLPVALVYGDDLYIHDCVCDNGKPEAVEPKIVAALGRNGVGLARFESNSAGGRVADDVAKACREKGIPVDVRKRFSTENKETRILADSMWIKERCVFRSDAPTPDYARFIAMLTSYSTEGKNAHDDAPDAMSMLRRLMGDTARARVQAVRRIA